MRTSNNIPAPTEAMHVIVKDDAFGSQVASAHISLSVKKFRLVVCRTMPGRKTITSSFGDAGVLKRKPIFTEEI